jgi:YHS domain-containing protein
MRLIIAAFSVVIGVVPLFAWGASSISGAKDGVAIQGYDAVAYHAQSKDVKGTPDFRHEWRGTVWFFSSDANRALFAENPEKYAPQYGGHCALAIAHGRDSRGAGDAWTIRDGKLYLNGSKEVRTRWLQGVTQNIYWGDRNWPVIKTRLESQ